MKILLIVFCMLSLSCRSQIISLEEVSQCVSSNSNCPPFTYAKDINNSLNKFVATWKGNYDGKTYELFLKKMINVEEDIKSDKIIGRVKITTATTPILTFYDDTSIIDDLETWLNGLYFQSDLSTYSMYFVGDSPQGCINYGNLFIKVTPSNSNELKILYNPEHDIAVGSCPSSFVSTFPNDKVITLIKQ